MHALQWSDELLDEARQTHRTVAAALVTRGVAGELVLTGGTSLPGTLTKGDVDLHLRVQPQHFPGAVARLRELYPTASPHAWAETLAVFDIPGPRATGLAVTPLGSEHDQRLRHTWDALRRSPNLLAEYNHLKATADPEDYERQKSDFFSRISQGSDTTGRRG